MIGERILIISFLLAISVCAFAQNQGWKHIDSEYYSLEIPESWTIKKAEKTEREIKETIPFTIAMKKIKYLGIYLPKETNLVPSLHGK